TRLTPNSRARTRSDGNRLCARRRPSRSMSRIFSSASSDFLMDQSAFGLIFERLTYTRDIICFKNRAHRLEGTKRPIDDWYDIRGKSIGRFSMSQGLRI